MVGGWSAFFLFTLVSFTSIEIHWRIWGFVTGFVFWLYLVSVLLVFDYLLNLLNLSNYWRVASEGKKALVITVLTLSILITAFFCFWLLFLAYFDVIYPYAYHT